jgi:iron complex outermembrane receptor protein
VAIRQAYWLAAAALCFPAAELFAQARASDNALTQAEDAFGFSIGRESLGIYSAGNARGFSPTAAGNVRIDGLYFDPAFGLTSAIVGSTSIKVGLSAQGYPFAAPSGIVDQKLRRPDDKKGASIIANGDSYGSGGLEVSGSLPLSETLALGYGLTGNHVEFPDGTDNWNHSQSLLLRWRPAAGVEVVPFWALSNDYDDEAGTFYVPAGRFLPPQPRMDRFEGPSWSNYRYSATNHGVVASVAPAKDWLVRLGAFRSVNDQKTSFTNLLAQEQPDGSGERILIADPRSKNVSLSGELRVTHSIAEGPRLHVVHVSVRQRDARREFGGSEVIDLGPGRLGERVNVPKPEFQFGELSRHHVRQTTYGAAYNGRWKDVGEIGFGLSRASYRKDTDLADAAPVVARSSPWLYYATAAANVTRGLTVYGGYSRGLEESGTAPPNAANRNEPLPTILTEQKDAGLRLQLSKDIRAVGGVFDLSKPYFGFDPANRFAQVGTTRSRGAEFSISGRLSPRVDLVAGGVLLRPRVVRDPGVPGAIGPRPVGLPGHQVNLNVNWRTPWKEGLQLDLALLHRGSSPATTDNLVYLPPRPRADIGGRYRFKLAKRDATMRLQVINIFDKRSFNTVGAGIYAPGARRFVTGYLAVDL